MSVEKEISDNVYDPAEEISRLRHENKKQALQITLLQQDRDRLRQRVKELEYELADPQAFAKTCKNAERYRIVRAQHWESSPFAVVMDPKNAVKLGYDCPSEERLDEIVDGLTEPGEPL